MTIGNNIRHYRKLQGFTQKQLAEKANIATITLQQYEAGKRTPREAQLNSLAKELKVHPNMLLINSNTSLDIFTELLALTEWELTSFSHCDENPNCPLTEDEEVNRYALGIVPDVCETCEYNHAYYYLSNGKKYLKIDEDELSILENCLVPYLNLRISELFQGKTALTEKEFRKKEYGQE